MRIKDINRIFAALVFLSIFFVGCGGGNNRDHQTSDFSIPKIDLKEKTIDIEKTTTLKGSIMEYNREGSEIYTNQLLRERKSFLIELIDIETGTVKKKKTFPVGSFKSPTDFYSLDHLDIVAGRYYIVDQFYKYVVYDDQFNRVSSNFFGFHKRAKYRRFIDFYHFKGKDYFVYCHHVSTKRDQRQYVGLYEAPENNRPERVAELFEARFEVIPWTLKEKNHSKYRYSEEIWAMTYGFEKDKKIYYSPSNENRYYVYDLDTKKTVSVALGYLEPKRFTDEQADRFHMKHAHDPEYDQLHKEKYNVTRLHVAYPGDIYHFGFYDIGKGKIGVIGALDFGSSKFRMDILNSKTHQYEISVWLPVDFIFWISIKDSSRGNRIFLDLDNGFYLWHTRDGYEPIELHISKIKLVDYEKKIGSV